MSRVSVNLVCCACAVLACIGIAAAQTTNATIVGDVNDPNGGRIASAAVKVTNCETRVIQEVTTNEVGSYRVFPLNPGNYEAEAKAALDNESITWQHVGLRPGAAYRDFQSVRETRFSMELTGS